MVEPRSSLSQVLYPEDRELSWRDRYRIRCRLGKAEMDEISRAEQICYNDMKTRQVETVLQGHEDTVAALFREGAREFNALHLASTAGKTAVSPSARKTGSDTSQCQPSAASLQAPNKLQLSALDWFSRLQTNRSPLSTCCNSPYQPGSFLFASARQPPTLPPTPYDTPTTQDKTAQTPSAAL